MAEVTVEQLAKTVGTDAAKLLSQMKDAGLPHKKADETVSDDDKRTLLSHLKRSHGSDEEAPRKITLKRKSVSTLKTGGSSGKRTVNVEVRKKRTYVKRPEIEETAELESVESDAVADAEVTATPEPITPVVEEPTPDPEPIVEEPVVEEVAAAPEVEIQPEPEPEVPNCLTVSDVELCSSWYFSRHRRRRLPVLRGWGTTPPWTTRASASTCARRSSPRWLVGTC